MSREEALAVIFVFGFGAMLLWPLVKAFGDRIRRGPAGPDPRGTKEIEALRDAMMAEVQQVRRELEELSERVDFTERLLAKQREGDRLPPAH